MLIGELGLLIGSKIRVVINLWSFRFNLSKRDNQNISNFNNKITTLVILKSKLKKRILTHKGIQIKGAQKTIYCNNKIGLYLY